MHLAMITSVKREEQERLKARVSTGQVQGSKVLAPSRRVKRGRISYAPLSFFGPFLLLSKASPHVDDYAQYMSLPGESRN